MNKRYVLKLFSRDSLKTMSGSKKKLYKLLLTALASNVLVGQILNNDSKSIISELEKLLNETYNAETYDMEYEKYREYLKNQFVNNHVIKLSNEDDYQNLIEFTRRIFEALIEKNVSVYTRAEIEKYMDISAHLFKFNENIRWIGVNFETGIYPVIPEKLVWYDYKIKWNIFAKYKKESLDKWIDAVNANKQYERIYDKEIKEIEYIAGAMERSVLVSAITFVESFLYNIRMTIKNNQTFSKYIDCNLNKMLQNEKINDTEIVEKILFNIYPALKNLVSCEYETYKELLKLRDRYVHISVREDGDRQPEMSLLLSSAGLNIEMKMGHVLCLVNKINDMIVSSDKTDMLWWRKDEPCNFLELELYEIVSEAKR